MDVTEQCPLCYSVLVQDDDLENMYPDVRMRIKKLMLISRIYLFCVLVAEAILLWINIRIGGRLWSLIAGMVLLYIYLMLRYTVLGKTSYRKKVIVSILVGVISLIAVDYLTGRIGWSFEYAIPTLIIGMNFYLIYVMIDRMRTWQSYIMWQIGIVLCSLGPAVMYLLQIVKTQYALLPLALSAATLAGMFIIGGNRAKSELKRRFHM